MQWKTQRYEFVPLIRAPVSEWAEAQKLNVAFHEAGHAAVGFAIARKLVAVELTINIEIDGPNTFPFSGGTTAQQPSKPTLASVHDYATLAAAG